MYDMENGLLCTVMHDGKEKESSLQAMPARIAAQRRLCLGKKAEPRAGLGGNGPHGRGGQAVSRCGRQAEVPASGPEECAFFPYTQWEGLARAFMQRLAARAPAGRKGTSSVFS